MNSEPNFDRDHEVFSAKRTEDIVIVRFKDNPLLRAADLSAKDAVLNYLDLVSRTNSIKAAVLIDTPREADPMEYIEFFQHVSAGNMDQIAVERIQNAVDQLIARIIELNKIVVHLDIRRKIPLLLNVGLACDYRIVSDAAVFHNLHLDLGLAPKGGAAFFLSKMVGVHKAREILLSVEDLTSWQALELGIVNEVVTPDTLEEAAMKRAQRLTQVPGTSLAGVKRLINYSMGELSDYLEFENAELFRIIHSSEFQRKIRKYNLNKDVLSAESRC